MTMFSMFRKNTLVLSAFRGDDDFLEGRKKYNGRSLRDDKQKRVSKDRSKCADPFWPMWSVALTVSSRLAPWNLSLEVFGRGGLAVVPVAGDERFPGDQESFLLTFEGAFAAAAVRVAVVLAAAVLYFR